MRLEKRKENRVVLSVPVRYKVYQVEQLEKDIRDQELKSGAEIKNLSIGGLQVVAAQPLPVGGVLELELEVPGKGMVRSVAKVVWSTRDDKAVCEYISGIQFIPVYEEDLQKVQEYLKSGE